ncbi:MAG TPA: biopolymer transporter ExbD [Bacteroidia bacterium]|nr:biopolymer transporter ExbD [Bacteroidia bacterium]
MKLRRKNKEGAEVFTDSLNDIMFFLLLFFIIISTLANPNVIKMELPSSKSVSPLTDGKVLLQIDANHNYYVNNVPITIDQMETALLHETQAKGTNSVILSLDKSLTVQDLADVLQIGSKLGLKMVLSAKPSNTQ